MKYRSWDQIAGKCVMPYTGPGNDHPFSKIDFSEVGVGAGTRVSTSTGLQCVEKLVAGVQIISPKVGSVTLLAIRSFLLKTRPILIRQNSFGKNLPTQHLVLAPLQPLRPPTEKILPVRETARLVRTPRALLNGHDIIEVPAAGGFRVFQLSIECNSDFLADGIAMLSHDQPTTF